jgi:carboxylesterase type B
MKRVWKDISVMRLLTFCENHRIYGGAYVLGDKGGIYNATGVARAGSGTLIHVAGNYRLGAFGFLAGHTIEKDNTATANAGFHDQRAVLEWIQKYIVRADSHATQYSPY